MLERSLEQASVPLRQAGHRQRPRRARRGRTSAGGRPDHPHRRLPRRRLRGQSAAAEHPSAASVCARLNLSPTGDPCVTRDAYRGRPCRGNPRGCPEVRAGSAPLRPLSLWERLERGPGRGAEVPLFSPREKIEMRGPPHNHRRLSTPWSKPSPQAAPPRNSSVSSHACSATASR